MRRLHPKNRTWIMDTQNNVLEKGTSLSNMATYGILMVVSKRISYRRISTCTLALSSDPGITDMGNRCGVVRWNNWDPKNPKAGGRERIALIEEILHQMGCTKPCKYWDKLSIRYIHWCKISSSNSMRGSLCHSSGKRWCDKLYCKFVKESPTSWQKWNLLLIFQCWKHTSGGGGSLPFLAPSVPTYLFGTGSNLSHWSSFHRPVWKKSSQFPKIYQHLSVQFLLKKQVHCKSTRLLWLPFNVLVGRFAIKRGVILACFVLYSHLQLGTTLCHCVNPDLSSSHFCWHRFFLSRHTMT